jgi:FixJ family two-component response regulator
VSPNNRIVSIVEDDLSNTLFYQEVLKQFRGITIVTFADHVLALKHFQEYDYAYVLVITDLKLEGLV